jgi:hypothetical protein
MHKKENFATIQLHSSEGAQWGEAANKKIDRLVEETEKEK